MTDLMAKEQIEAGLERAEQEYAAWGLDREPDIEFGQCARDRLALARDLLAARERMEGLEKRKVFLDSRIEGFEERQGPLEAELIETRGEIERRAKAIKYLVKTRDRLQDENGRLERVVGAARLANVSMVECRGRESHLPAFAALRAALAQLDAGEEE